MKIAYLSVLPPPGEPALSGVYRVSESLLRQYETLPGIQVEVLTMIDALPREQVIQRGNVRYHYLPCKARGKTATFYVQEVRALRERLRDLQVDIIHGQPTAEYLLATTGAKQPHVITVHGLVARESAGMSRISRGYYANWIRELLHRRAIRRAQNIITISQYVAAYLEPLTAARRWPVGNPIEPEFFAIPRPTQPGLRMLCIGTVSERKNQMLLVEACRELARTGVDFQARIVGPVREGSAYLDRLRTALQEKELGGRVEMTGPVSQAEVLKHYEWATAVVLPSYEESSSLALMQAMAAQRCAFGARCAALPEVLDQGRLGTMFSPQDPVELAGLLREFVRNPEVALARAEIAAAHARETFPAEAVARRTVAVYESVMRRPLHPGGVEMK